LPNRSANFAKEQQGKNRPLAFARGFFVSQSPQTSHDRVQAVSWVWDADEMEDAQRLRWEGAGKPAGC
jgi:hypothetical protein